MKGEQEWTLLCKPGRRTLAVLPDSIEGWGEPIPVVPKSAFTRERTRANRALGERRTLRSTLTACEGENDRLWDRLRTYGDPEAIARKHKRL
jgi:hypothetical protein